MTTKSLLAALLAGSILLMLAAPSEARTMKMHKRVLHRHARVMHHATRNRRLTRTRTQTTASFRSTTTNANTPPAATNTVPTVTPSPGVSNVGTVTHGIGTAGNLGRRTTAGTGALGEKTRRTVPVPGSGVGTTTAPNR